MLHGEFLRFGHYDSPTLIGAVLDDAKGGALRSPSSARRSARAVDGNAQGRAHLAHPIVSQATQPGHEDGNGDALDGIQVHRATAGNRILGGVQDDLAGESTNGGRAGRDERASKPRQRGVPGQDDHGAAADLRQLAPPHLPAGGRLIHEAAAAPRNDARSPHSSGSSTG